MKPPPGRRSGRSAANSTPTKSNPRRRRSGSRRPSPASSATRPIRALSKSTARSSPAATRPSCRRALGRSRRDAGEADPHERGCRSWPHSRRSATVHARLVALWDLWGCDVATDLQRRRPRGVPLPTRASSRDRMPARKRRLSARPSTPPRSPTSRRSAWTPTRCARTSPPP